MSARERSSMAAPMEKGTYSKKKNNHEYIIEKKRRVN